MPSPLASAALAASSAAAPASPAAPDRIALLLRPVEESLHAACGCDSFRVDWHLPAAMSRGAAALDSLRLVDPETLADAHTAACPDRVTLRLRGVRAGGAIEYVFSGETFCRVTVWVAVHPLRAGQALASSDLRSDRGWYPPSALPEGERAAPGSYLRRSVPRGGFLSRGDVTEPPMVRRGQELRILYRSPGLSLEARGVARRDGWTGDNVAVRVLGAARDCEGVVSGAGEVEIGGDVN
jgi:flagella basal body P-ring formation protein FlgA